MLQEKVIGERPLPGIAHAFVFWGFCAFALVTLNHVASGFGLRILESRSGFGAFYYWFAFAWAVMVGVSIAGLAFRRFVIRPKWLEPMSVESGFIALLIFLLMATYVAIDLGPRKNCTGCNQLVATHVESFPVSSFNTPAQNTYTWY